MRATAFILAGSMVVAAGGAQADGEDANAFRKRPLYVVQPVESRFVAASAAQDTASAPVWFMCIICGVLLQHGLAIEAGKKVARASELVDPSIAVGEGLARDFCAMLACSEVRIVEQRVPRHINSARELRDLVPADAYAIVVRTNAWGFDHLASHWKRYRTFYRASVVVVDMASGRRLARRQLSYLEKFEDRHDAPTRDELLADDGTLLNRKLKETEGHAIVEFSQSLRDRWVVGVRDMEEFAERYTTAWCGQDPAAVAAFYEKAGSLTINGGEPAVGRPAIEEVARSFMQAFPDMIVRMDGLERDRGRYIYRWTLSGTNAGPGGTGARVIIGGQERWEIGPDGRIMASLGSFDEAEYQRQLRK